ISIFRPSDTMTLHDSSKHGEFCWGELLTTDQKAAFAFYSKLFNWECLDNHDMGPMGNYLIYGRNGQRMGGMFNKPKDMPMPPTFLYYIQVSDLDAVLARAQSKGAKVLNGPMEVPGGARIVQLADPQGAAFALHTLPTVKPAA